MITFLLCVVIDEEKKSVREFAEAEESILNTLTIAGMYLGEVSAGLTFSTNEASSLPADVYAVCLQATTTWSTSCTSLY